MVWPDPAGTTNDPPWKKGSDPLLPVSKGFDGTFAETQETALRNDLLKLKISPLPWNPQTGNWILVATKQSSPP